MMTNQNCQPILRLPSLQGPDKTLENGKDTTPAHALEFPKGLTPKSCKASVFPQPDSKKYSTELAKRH